MVLPMIYINLYSPTSGSKEKENIHTYKNKYGEKATKTQKKQRASVHVYSM